MTEVNETRPETAPQGWLLYDGECRFCTVLARRFEQRARRRGFLVLPLQTPWVQRELGIQPDAPLREMVLLTRDRRRFGGIDALLYIAEQSIATRPFALLGRVGIIHRRLEQAYAWVAARRACLGGACTAPTKQPDKIGVLTVILDWLPLLVLPAAAFETTRQFPAWVFMWALAGTIFLGAKWLTWRKAMRDGAKPRVLRSVGYFCAWPGMNASTFLTSDRPVSVPVRREWFAAGIKTVLGALLLWLGVRLAPSNHPLLVGWVGMLGLILLLHFGSFHVLSLVWRRGGVEAQPLMDRPLAARSVADFWSHRWNAAFNDLVRRHVFRPSARLGGSRFAVLAVFGVSGLLHDLVISWPARGGFGLPTAYFLLQGFAVLIERTTSARRAGLGRGWRGWLFTLLCTAGPIGILFHPSFVRNVILPFLRAIGAL